MLPLFSIGSKNPAPKEGTESVFSPLPHLKIIEIQSQNCLHILGFYRVDTTFEQHVGLKSVSILLKSTVRQRQDPILTGRGQDLLELV